MRNRFAVTWFDKKMKRPCSLQFSKIQYRDKFIRGLEQDSMATDIVLKSWNPERGWQIGA